MKIKEIAKEIEAFAPLAYQEDYDNSGFQVGSPDDEIKGVLITIDVTEAVIDEAIEKQCNLIIAHHPLIFGKVKKIIGRNSVERCIIKAIKNDITIYACHTNIDKMSNGVSARFAQKLGLVNCRTLVAESGLLEKLVTFVPQQQAEHVRQALYSAGAGHIGNYDHCSYNIDGKGTFRASNGCNPFVGEIGEDHTEPETRIEVILKKKDELRIIEALLANHPYEEPAYDIFELKNRYESVGLGTIGELENEEDEKEFLLRLKKTIDMGGIRHTELLGKKIKRVALCGGSGAEFLQDAIGQGADIYISCDFKYHQFFDAEKKILIADVGHFESERFTKEIFFEIVSKNNPKFAVYISSCKTNPINYI